jgi:hypothetical protein
LGKFKVSRLISFCELQGLLLLACSAALSYIHLAECQLCVS